MSANYVKFVFLKTATTSDHPFFFFEDSNDFTAACMGRFIYTCCGVQASTDGKEETLFIKRISKRC